MHFAVACCMRNEAMFVLEWIAHQRLIGFRTIIVVTNDCTDGTDTICDAIAQHDPDFIHIRNTLAPGEAPQIKGMEKVFAHPVVANVDYLLHCDADEFLNISCGAGHVGDLIALCGRADCIALAWRPFGDANHKRWAGGLVTEKCTRSTPKLRPSFTVHKSIFKPAKFTWATDHMPKMPRSPNVTLVNTKREPMPTASLFNPRHARFRRTGLELFTWDNACIHHHAIRSEDVFLMKNLRGDGMARETQRYYINSKFWRRNNVNRNEIEVPTRHLTALRAGVAQLRMIADVQQIEARAIADFQIERDRFLTPAMIAQLTLD